VSAKENLAKQDGVMKNAFTLTSSTACVSNHRSVLLTDDNPHRRNALVLLLNLVHFNVSPVHSASEGLTLAKQGGFDLILISSLLSDNDGAELCRQIRDFDKRTPILFYSGEARNAETKAEWPLTPKQGMGILPAYV
jgi:CheY-like chemotaxis protein